MNPNMTSDPCPSCGQDHPVTPGEAMQINRGPQNGRVGYEAYNAHQGGKNHKGDPIPSWAMNPREDIKAAWAAAESAVIDQFIADLRHFNGQYDLETAIRLARDRFAGEHA